jgi:hypothetical protein
MKLISVHHNPVKIYPIKDRLYMVAEGATCCLRTDAGCLVYTVKPGFEFDSRSGGKLVDWLVPHLGSQSEVWAWLVHDIGYYDWDVCFETCNDLLKQQLIMDAHMSAWKASLVKYSVDEFGRSSFGIDNAKDITNRKLINFEWMDDNRGLLICQTIAFRNDKNKLNNLEESSLEFRRKWAK